MIISNHGISQLLVTSCALVVVVCSKNKTEWMNGASPSNLKNETDKENTLPLTNGAKSVAEIVKSQRRASRFDTAASSPWVRVYNRPPGTKSEAYYNYETRGNTSAHTSGERWDSFRDDSSGAVSGPLDRSDKKVKDILRVKPKQKEIPKTDAPKSISTTQSVPTTKSAPLSTKSPEQIARITSTKLDNKKKGYIIWSSNDGESSAAWTLDDSAALKEKKSEPAIEEMIPKDGSHWKVVGDGGEGGWEVIDDKGDVEWKIEYDDGEWRVTSTGDVPADAEWIDPEYVWGTPEGSVPQDNEYNSYPSDDYRVPPIWPDPEVFLRELANDSWIRKDSSEQGKKVETGHISETGWKINESPDSAPVNTNEKIQFGARRKTPTNPLVSSSTEDKLKSESSEEVKSDSITKEKPQSDQVILTGKSWVPETPVVKSGQKWVQGYGTKTWEGDNSGWNAEVGGETWIAADKNYDLDPWVPKIPGVKSTPAPQRTSTEDSSSSKQDNPVRAWGTGYGSKTWKGNEWNSNVVWKTGFNSGLPWALENSTWKFPEQNEDKKKPEVWSQPMPDNKGQVAIQENTPPPSRAQDGIRIKWPGKPVKRGNAIRKSPPSRRAEGESWDDDSSVGGVLWMQQGGDTSSQPAAENTKSNDQENGWQIGGWKVSTPSEEWKPTISPWKSKTPLKNSNLISVTWKAGDNPLDSAPDAWNQGDWPDASGEPTWIFKGCKMTLKCGSNNDYSDNDDESNFPDTSDDDTMIPLTTTTTPPPPTSMGKIWPARPSKGKGKSWKPPSKSWRPPKWKQPTPAPTTPETMNPTMTWKSPPPSTMKWGKPTPPPDMWKLPPSTMMMPETTPEPPKMSWKPPPPPMKWKKGPKPTKSWRPPPTKSWKPPKQPSKTWEPSIATPQPDMWPTTKPDCKETTQMTQPPPTEDDIVDPPQIIIITKLPKGSTPGAIDKKDSKDDAKRKYPFGPWNFPPRKNVPKSSKNRRDKNIPIRNSKGQPNRPSRNYFKPPNKLKGWPKGMPTPSKSSWPNNAMRRWTTKRPQSWSAWKSKYSKSNAWKQMLKKWMNGR